MRRLTFQGTLQLKWELTEEAAGNQMSPPPTNFSFCGGDWVAAGTCWTVVANGDATVVTTVVATVVATGVTKLGAGEAFCVVADFAAWFTGVGSSGCSGFDKYGDGPGCVTV